jgi:hypothetical protein
MTPDVETSAFALTEWAIGLTALIYPRGGDLGRID